jgi:hypothetical protein
MASKMPDDPKPLIAFDTNDPEFVRGFEIGRLWTMLRTEPEQSVEEYLRATNVEMALRLAESTGRNVQSTELSDTWLFVRFGPATASESALGLPDSLDEAA